MDRFPTVKFPVKIPHTRPIDMTEDGRPCFVLEESFKVIINNRDFIIPAGVKFDYASVPIFLTNIFPPDHPDWQAASLLHDVAYQGELWPREFNDKLFLSAMCSTNVNWFKRNTMWLAVRIGGGFTYKRHTLESVMYIRNLMGLLYDSKRPLWPEW